MKAIIYRNGEAIKTIVKPLFQPYQEFVSDIHDEVDELTDERGGVWYEIV